MSLRVGGLIDPFFFDEVGLWNSGDPEFAGFMNELYTTLPPVESRSASVAETVITSVETSIPHTTPFMATAPSTLTDASAAHVKRGKISKERLLQSRESSKRYRAKKNAMFAQLEADNAALKKNNDDLIRKVELLIGENQLLRQQLDGLKRSSETTQPN